MLEECRESLVSGLFRGRMRPPVAGGIITQQCNYILERHGECLSDSWCKLGSSSHRLFANDFLFVTLCDLVGMYAYGRTRQYTLHASVPGQGVMLHSWYSCAAPAQVWPPYLGSGLVQVLFRLRIPRLQSRLHWDQELQDDQPPFTVWLDILPRRSTSPVGFRGQRQGGQDDKKKHILYR